MCGIVGMVDAKGLIDPMNIKAMTDSIAHRGPDSEGYFFANHTGYELQQDFKHPNCNFSYALGHRRLSIIDHNGGCQPLCNEEENIWITYNGEIYNHAELRNNLIASGHVFKSSHSDTEVIVHAYEQWGISAFDKLNGIFGFGILDLKKKKLIIARDHFGVKPIYYFFDKNRFIFSSEIKAILACNDVKRELDINALNDYLSFRYVPSPRTAFRNIFKLEAGGYLIFDLDKNTISATGNYATHNPAVDQDKSFAQWMEEYQYYFEQAVTKQLISDVEVGALLSGGMDSSAVCAIASHSFDYPLRTYTVGFKDFPEGNEFDEASEFANHLGSIHKNVVIDNLDFVNVLDEVAWFMDEPTATSSTIPLYYLTKVIKNDVKVVLTGQGADELLAGYPRYWGEYLYGAGFKYLSCLQPLVEKLPRNERLKRAFRSFGRHDTFDRFMNVYYLFNPEQKKALMKDPVLQENNSLHSKLFSQYQGDNDLGRMLYMDTRAWLPDDLLIYGDKATMINGIEARVPILDKELVSFIESIPSKYKLSWRFEGKLIHKRVCQKWLPPFVQERGKKGFGTSLSKKGFETPINGWFRNKLSGYIQDQLISGRISRKLFNSSTIEEMIQKHKSGKENFQRHLFALLMLEKWAEKFDVHI